MEKEMLENESISVIYSRFIIFTLLLKPFSASFFSRSYLHDTCSFLASLPIDPLSISLKNETLAMY